MYAHGSNDLTMSVNLDGFKMQLSMEGHARKRVYERSCEDASFVFHRIAILLETPSVSEYILDNVKIGDDCVICDSDTGFSYALMVLGDEIKVKTVYYPQTSNDTLRIGRTQLCVYVKKAEVVCADVYSNIRAAVNMMSMGTMQTASSDA